MDLPSELERLVRDTEHSSYLVRRLKFIGLYLQFLLCSYGSVFIVNTMKMLLSLLTIFQMHIFFICRHETERKRGLLFIASCYNFYNITITINRICKYLDVSYPTAGCVRPPRAGESVAFCYVRSYVVCPVTSLRMQEPKYFYVGKYRLSGLQAQIFTSVFCGLLFLPGRKRSAYVGTNWQVYPPLQMWQSSVRVMNVAEVIDAPLIGHPLLTSRYVLLGKTAVSFKLRCASEFPIFSSNASIRMSSPMSAISAFHSAISWQMRAAPCLTFFTDNWFSKAVWIVFKFSCDIL